MQVLFVHQNFPGQYRHLAPALAARGGQAVAQGLTQVREKGLKPDLICAQIGWGEAIFTKDVFPDAKLLLYCEFYYHARGADSAFDPEFPPRGNAAFRVHLMNLPLTAALEVADAGHAPTEWQRSQFPAHHKNRISVIHEGIDTARAAPGPDARVTLPDGRELTAANRVITYLTRNFEPYRGFHVFMRAIPEIQRRCPDATIVMV